jgi:hypothetical protein
MNAVFAPAEFAPATSKFEASGTIARNTSVSYFVRVPKGASALQVDLTGGGAPGQGQVRFLRYDPTGVPVDSNTSTNCYNPDAGAGCAGGSPTGRTLTNPLPGVWEITVEARRTSDVDSAPYRVSASVLGTTVSPNPDDIASAPAGVAQPRTYTVQNTLGAFTGHLAGGTFASASVQRPSIAQGASSPTQLTVTPGSTSLTVTIGNTTDTRADLDLSVYNCATGSCVLAGQSAGSGSEESVTIPNPAAGRWVAVVDGYAVPAGTTAYDYFDAFTNPAFGGIAANDPSAAHASGSAWTVPATVTAASAPAAGRILRGALSVVTDAGVTIGGGTVLVRSVG